MVLFRPYKVFLVLGNGFDLSLGLLTSYNSFLESDIFKKKVNIKHYPNAKMDEHDRNIHNYLTMQKRLKDWIDVEMELMKYASQQRVEYHNDKGGVHSLQNVSDNNIRNSYQILCLDLQAYMMNLDYSLLRKDALALNLFRMIVASRHSKVVSFNYTELNRLLEGKARCDIEYIHGNVNNGIILGFQRHDNMAAGYDYMIKSENPNYKSCHLFDKMREADETIIFGHSLGVTDHCYFSQFFDEQTSTTARNKRLTIFTLNVQSKESIVRQMVTLSGGKYREFQDNTDVTIIETKNNDAGVLMYLEGLKKRMKRIWWAG